MRKIAGYLTKNRSGKDQKIAQSTHENGYIKPRKTFWRNSKQLLNDSLNKIDQQFLEKITHVITDNLSSTETIDISFLASHLCMSNSTLYRKVKALTGMSTNEYIRKIKMQLAEKMLLEGKYNISEIAFKVGINSTVYFRQCFKEEFGITPSEYLKKIKQG